MLLVGWWLRMRGLGGQSLWVDEGYSYLVARGGPGAVLSLLPSEDRHPPLHYLLLWVGMQLWGGGEAGLRFPSALAGTATIALVYALGRRLGGRAVGVVGALFLTLSPFHVWYSQEARMYALLALLGTAALLAWLDALRGGRVGAAAFAFLAAAGLYTHYYAAFLLAAAALTLLPWAVWALRRAGMPSPYPLPEREAWRTGRLAVERVGVPLAAVVGAALLFVPWLPAIASQGGRAGGGYRIDASLGQIVGDLLASFPFGEGIPRAGWAVAAFAGLALLGATVGPRPRREGLVLLAWAAAGPLGAYALSAGLGLELRATGRMYYLASLPAYLLLSARGLVFVAASASVFGARAQHAAPLHVASTRGWSALAVAAAVGVLAAGALVSAQIGALRDQRAIRMKEDFRGTARLVEQREWPGDVILIVAEPIFRDQPFAYYYRGRSPVLVADPAAPDLDAALRPVLAGRERVWLLLVHGTIADPPGRVETWLDRHATPLEDHPDPDVHLRLYSTEPRPRFDRPAVAQSRGIVLGGAVELVGLSTASAAPPVRASGGPARDGLGAVDADRAAGSPLATAGSALRVTLIWRAIAPVAPGQHAALLLTDASGQVRAQTDRIAMSPSYDTSRWEPGEYLTDRYDLPFQPSLAPGRYRLRLRLYAPETGRTLRPPDGAELVDLGPVRIGAEPDAPPPTMTHPVGASLGGEVELLGYDLDATGARPGGRVRLTLYWRALARPARDYTVFTHLVGPDGALRGQHDGAPAGGARPTSDWESGEVVRDEHEIVILSEAPIGPYRLRVGMYRPDTGARLSGGQDGALDLPTAVELAP